jgi:hypothetical protein
VKDIIYTAIAGKSNSSLDAMPMHTTHYGGAMEYLASSNMYILNCDNEPTFVVRNRKEVIDLTLGTNEIANLVSNWHVSDETSLSDHRCICFELGNISIGMYLMKRLSQTTGTFAFN